jgi:XTP/dITP diphosphohydrolase
VTAGRITLLLTSPRVAPGLLSWPAWQLLQRADRVFTDDPEHPQRAALEAAGVRVRTLSEEIPDAEQPARAEWTARWLVDQAAADTDLVWLASDDGSWLGRALGHLLASRAEAGETDLPELEVVPGSYDLPGARLLDLVSVMDQLRARCPWVRQQTHRSLVRYLVEETYETVEAVETGDRAHLREELGDLLFQVVFHARLASEHPEAPFTIDDVAGDLVEKLIRRNPHVFGSAPVGDVAEIENMWDALKKEEKGRRSALEGVPLALPALTLADKLLGRTAGRDIDVLTADEPHLPDRPTADQIGDALFALVRRAHAAGIDPEQALRDACRRFVEAVQAAEAQT